MKTHLMKTKFWADLRADLRWSLPFGWPTWAGYLSQQWHESLPAQWLSRSLGHPWPK